MADKEGRVSNGGAAAPARKKRQGKRKKRGKTDPVGGQSKEISTSLDNDLHKESLYSKAHGEGDAANLVSPKVSLESVQPLITVTGTTEIKEHGNNHHPVEEVGAGGLVTMGTNATDEEKDKGIVEKNVMKIENNTSIDEVSSVDDVAMVTTNGCDVRAVSDAQQVRCGHDDQVVPVVVEVPPTPDEVSEDIPSDGITDLHSQPLDMVSPVIKDTSDLEDPMNLMCATDKLLEEAGIRQIVGDSMSPLPVHLQDRIAAFPVSPLSADLLEEAGVLTENTSAETMLATPKARKCMMDIEAENKWSKTTLLFESEQSNMAREGVIFDGSIEVEVMPNTEYTESAMKSTPPEVAMPTDSEKT
ncbi:uncharacterized protein LOC102807355 isoform X2 [Saccoglossus kowalevskii]|uniref:Uncharacterized protein LOC102807355 isoform X1 n=1 Tax=Saccoglossus kowalevskii TaxID=10224 RepID=A0ABM0M862_SACKO|nr:PREDICTED: uncharacterized protein LOC102807355 isoform X1 [Saccoglossus kowalevskii]